MVKIIHILWIFINILLSLQYCLSVCGGFAVAVEIDCMMVKTKVQVDEFLAQWARGKWWDDKEEAVRFPPGSDIYHLLYDLLRRRPEGVGPTDQGNLVICLPDRREGDTTNGKRPEVYNYVSRRGSEILCRRMRTMFWAECHELMDENKHIRGIDSQDTAYMIICQYDITAITDDAIKKNYQRWRDKMRRRHKRGYVFREHGLKRLKKH